MRLSPLFGALCFIAVLMPVLTAAEVTITTAEAGESSGQDAAKVISAAIKKVASEGGGTVHIRAGRYLITQPIVLNGLKKITVRGQAGTILKLTPLAYGKLAEPMKAGDETLALAIAQGLHPGQELKVQAPGAIHPFTKKPAPYFVVRPLKVEGTKLTLSKPAEYAADAGTEILWDGDPNLFEVRGAAEEITFEHLQLDGGATAETPQIATHNTRCGFWVTGNYDYETGPKGPKPRAITIRSCHLSGFNGRGVAFYSAEAGIVEDCRIDRCLEEAIDFDHFAIACIARRNVLSDCRLGVELNDANDCVVEQNFITGGTAGVRIWRWCKMPELNVRNRIAENRFMVGTKLAVELLEGTSQNAVVDNVIASFPGKTLPQVTRDRGTENAWERNSIEVPKQAQ